MASYIAAERYYRSALKVYTAYAMSIAAVCGAAALILSARFGGVLSSADTAILYRVLSGLIMVMPSGFACWHVMFTRHGTAWRQVDEALLGPRTWVWRVFSTPVVLGALYLIIEGHHATGWFIVFAAVIPIPLLALAIVVNKVLDTLRRN